MEVRIIEKEDRGLFMDMPLTYRVGIRVNRGYIELSREYFRTGFSDGEDFDKFYFDNEWCGRQGSPLYRCTFITRKLDDKEYLEKSENRLIEEFYKRCIKSRDLLERKLREQTRELTRDIKNYDDMVKHFSYIERGKKLKLIKKKIK
jgi:hypothetical protein